MRYFIYSFLVAVCALISNISGPEYARQIGAFLHHKYIMAITDNQHEKQMFEAFKKFSDLYNSKVEYTGEVLRKVGPINLSKDPLAPITYTESKEIAIKMPLDEYERFLVNWSTYIDLMYVAKYNPMLGEEFQKLQMLVQLLK